MLPHQMSTVKMHNLTQGSNQSRVAHCSSIATDSNDGLVHTAGHAVVLQPLGDVVYKTYGSAAERYLVILPISGYTSWQAKACNLQCGGRKADGSLVRMSRPPTGALPKNGRSVS